MHLIFVIVFALFLDANAEPLCQKVYQNLQTEEKSNLDSKITKFGVTMKHILKSGNENPDSKIGCYAGDDASYIVYEKLFNPVISQYHKNNSIVTTDHSLSKIAVSNEKILGDNVISTRFRVARNLSSMPFPSSMSKTQRLEVEKLIISAIKKLPKDYQGTYYSLSSLNKKSYEKLLEEHLIFKDNDKYLESAGIFNDWPYGRGSYISNNKKFMIWINEEDHMRIIYLTREKNIEAEYNNFVDALNILEKELNFAHNEKLGYLNSCPTNIGTALRVSVHIKLENKNKDNFDSIAKKYGLALRGTYGEHSDVLGGVFDISNSKRMSITGEKIITDLISGINELSR